MTEEWEAIARKHGQFEYDLVHKILRDHKIGTSVSLYLERDVVEWTTRANDTDAMGVDSKQFIAGADGVIELVVFR